MDKLLINREYAKLWAAGAISWVGDYVFDVTVILWIAVVLAPRESWAPAAVSGVIAAVVVATVVVSPIAGVFVDRWDGRRTMLGSDALRMILVGALVIMPLIPKGTVPMAVQLTCIYVVVFASTAISRFFTPARFAVMADVVHQEQRPRASSIDQATMSVAGMVGPPLAAPLLFATGVQWAMLVDAASFGLSFLIIYRMRIPSAVRDAAAARTGFWTELRAGLSALTGSRVLIVIVASAMVANFGAYLLNTLNVFFVTHNLHAKPELFGLLDTAFGLGAVAGAAFAGRAAQRFGLARTFWVGLLGTGLMVLVYSRLSAFAAGLVILLVLAMPLSAMNTVIAPIVMRTAPREVLGRVFAIMQPAIQVMSVIAIGVAGWLSSSVLRGFHTDVAGLELGTYDTILGAAGLLISGCGLYAMTALRGSDTERQQTVTEPANIIT